MKQLLLDRNLALEAVRVTEIAAIASSFHMGRGNEKAADQAAVDSMRTELNKIDFILNEAKKNKSFVKSEISLGSTLDKILVVRIGFIDNNKNKMLIIYEVQKVQIHQNQTILVIHS